MGTRRRHKSGAAVEAGTVPAWALLRDGVWLLCPIFLHFSPFLEKKSRLDPKKF
jgi:hypothetical protein